MIISLRYITTKQLLVRIRGGRRIVLRDVALFICKIFVQFMEYFMEEMHI